MCNQRVDELNTVLLNYTVVVFNVGTRNDYIMLGMWSLT